MGVEEVMKFVVEKRKEALIAMENFDRDAMVWCKCYKMGVKEEVMKFVVEKGKEALIAMENFGGDVFDWFKKIFLPETRVDKIHHRLHVAQPYLITAGILSVIVCFCKRGGGGGGSGKMPRHIFEDNPKSSSTGTHEKYSAPFVRENMRRRVKLEDAAAQPPTTVGRWIKYYSSCHRILLVGEGDFSFSTCLATAFVWASNMIATSFDSQDFLMKNYRNALSNIAELKNRNCSIMHEIDTTTMATHHFLGNMKFDRIIFNFPYAGFYKNLSRQTQLRLHQQLVSMFMKNAKEMISEDGEIHMSHKTNGFHREWNIESVASLHWLRLIEAVDFNHLDYPGYNTKCGFGGDNNFNCYPSKTYKFRLMFSKARSP